MFRIAICDDEEYFRLREKQLISEYMESKYCGYEITLYSSGVELLRQKEEILQYDIPESDCQKNALLGIAFGLLVMKLIVFYLIGDIMKRESQIRENRIVLERVKHETGMYRTISENYEKQRKHEFKN